MGVWGLVFFLLLSSEFLLGGNGVVWCVSRDMGVVLVPPKRVILFFVFIHTHAAFVVFCIQRSVYLFLLFPFAFSDGVFFVFPLFLSSSKCKRVSEGMKEGD